MYLGLIWGRAPTRGASDTSYGLVATFTGHLSIIRRSIRSLDLVLVASREIL